MIDQQRITNVVFSAIDEINESLPEDKKFQKAMATVLFDPAGHIDSLGLTMFIVSIEQKIEQEFNVSLPLTGAFSMSDAVSPFRSVEALVSHIQSLLEVKING